MSDDEKTASDESKVGTYPRKYWWLILVAVPVALALIKLAPEFWNKPPAPNGGFKNQQTGTGNTAINGSHNIIDYSTKTYVINMAAIEKEYAEVKREPLADEELKKQIAQAIELLKTGKAAESAAAFEKINQKVSLPSLQTDMGVAYQQAGNINAATLTFTKVLDENPGYGAAHHNLGVAKATRGELVEARAHFEKAGEIAESKVLARGIAETVKAGDQEVEPNDEIAQANVLPLENEVAGNIFDSKDIDCFRVTTPPKYRDILQVAMENKSSTALRPHLGVRNRNGSHVSNTYDITPGASLEHTFSAPPETTFFITVSGDSSTGRYGLTVKPLKKYDAFEPNEDSTKPARIEIGQEISANIMDNADVDFYQFKTAAQGATAKVHLENQSSTLRPHFDIRNPSKSGMPGRL